MPYGFFEDMRVGDVHELGSHTFTLEDIKRFAAKFDPQSFHLDEEAAKDGPFGALTASGWHTTSVMMKLLVEAQDREAERRAKAGLPRPEVGPSPGFENLSWRRPVFAGDRLTYAIEITNKRTLASRPHWGLIFQRVTAVNQDGDVAFEMDGKLFLKRLAEA